MNSWIGKMLLAIVGVLFLLKGGLVMMINLWRVLLPLLLLGGGIYFLKKAMAPKREIASKQKPARSFDSAGPQRSEVIHICPHCLQEMGSCKQCKGVRV